MQRPVLRQRGPQVQPQARRQQPAPILLRHDLIDEDKTMVVGMPRTPYPARRPTRPASPAWSPAWTAGWAGGQPTDQNRGLPHLTVVVVGKRYHTRFCASREVDADRSTNPQPGTVMDRGVTEARNWDFFLQSHAAIQGTARAAHYYVPPDEIFRARYAKAIPPGSQDVADVLRR